MADYVQGKPVWWRGDKGSDLSLKGSGFRAKRVSDHAPGTLKSLGLFVKIAVEVILAALLILMLLPVLVLVSLAIKLDSPGPVLYSQLRHGKGGVPIRVFKFRSMRADQCDMSGAKQCVEQDPRVTRVGKFLRKSNIDELPQLFSVLRGDMALIGPRCHPIGMLAAGVPYEELVPEYHDRHKMRPGITGLAQVRGLRGPTVRPSKARARIASDLYYVENYSLWLDIKIIFQTFRSEFLNGSGF